MNRVRVISWGVPGATLFYHVVDGAQADLIARTNTGIVEFPAGSGEYVITVSWTTTWSGQEIWDDGTRYVSEDVNPLPATAADVSAGGGGSASITITPILATANNPRYSTRDLPPIAQGSAPTEVWTIVDATGAAVDLSGKTVRCVFYLVTDTGTDEVSVIDDTLAASFVYETGGSGITVGGADSNQVTLQHSAANTATAGCYHYFLWNITDNIVLAKGRSPVEPAVKSL